MSLEKFSKKNVPLAEDSSTSPLPPVNQKETLMPMPSLVASSSPARRARASSSTVPKSQPSKLGIAHEKDTKKSHVRSSSSVNLTSAIREARGGRRHTKVASLYMTPKAYGMESNNDPPKNSHLQMQNWFNQAPFEISTNRVSAATPSGNSVNGSANGSDSAGSHGYPGGTTTNNTSLALPKVNFGHPNGSNTSLGSWSSSQAASRTRESSVSSSSNGGDHMGTEPGGISTLSSDDRRIADLPTTLTGVLTDLKTRMPTSSPELSGALNLQIAQFSTALADLKALHAKCSASITSFAAAQTSTETHERLVALRDQTAAFKLLDKLEERIQTSHATVQEYRTRLDVVNKWVDEQEKLQHAKKIRGRTLRKIVFVTVGVVVLAAYLWINGLAWPFKQGSKIIQTSRINQTLNEIVTCLEDIDNCRGSEL